MEQYETPKDSNANVTKEKRQNRDASINLFFWLCITGVILGVSVKIVSLMAPTEHKLKYWVYPSGVESLTGTLRHVHAVLKRIGYEKTNNNSNWDLLWSFKYPYRDLLPNLYKLKPHQKVNHFPGIGFITSKVDLATTRLKYIPRAFKLPGQKEDFLKYAKENKDALFLEKKNDHRGVYLKNVSDLDVSSGDTFVQEYIQKAFLVDGHRFDIGVYVAITSINPLRAYWYKGDVLFRYCPSKYYPFDANDRKKYVVDDAYLPSWKLPSLTWYMSTLGFGMKESFDAYVKSKGKDTTHMWDEIQNAIAEVLVDKEKHLVAASQKYASSTNFFELVRFDLMVDEDLKVYLLEANMSPNLSAEKKPPHQILYEQVLYNLFSLVGVSDQLRTYRSEDERETPSASQMVSTDKNIAVWPAECRSSCNGICDGLCALCKPCLTQQMRDHLLEAHREHLHRGDFRRIYPPALKPGTSPKEIESLKLSAATKAHYLWTQGKCNADITWCT